MRENEIEILCMAFGHLISFQAVDQLKGALALIKKRKNKKKIKPKSNLSKSHLEHFYLFYALFFSSVRTVVVNDGNVNKTHRAHTLPLPLTPSHTHKH